MFHIWHLYVNIHMVVLAVRFFYNLGAGRMTYTSMACDIIISTFFFVLTMYGTIMGGSGAVKITQSTDLGQAIGASPAK